MSDTQQAWCVIWDHAAQTKGPFEIAEVVPAVAARAGVAEDQARNLVNLIMGEADRLVEGSQFFRVEGSAIVPQPEFVEAVQQGIPAADAYPFEL